LILVHPRGASCDVRARPFLVDKSYVDGIELVTEYEAALTYWEKHKDLCGSTSHRVE
jgi:hypothetical protein